MYIFPKMHMKDKISYMYMNNLNLNLREKIELKTGNQLIMSMHTTVWISDNLV